MTGINRTETSGLCNQSKIISSILVLYKILKCHMMGYKFAASKTPRLHKKAIRLCNYHFWRIQYFNFKIKTELKLSEESFFNSPKNILATKYQDL